MDVFTRCWFKAGSGLVLRCTHGLPGGIGRISPPFDNPHEVQDTSFQKTLHQALEIRKRNFLQETGCQVIGNYSPYRLGESKKRDTKSFVFCLALCHRYKSGTRCGCNCGDSPSPHTPHTPPPLLRIHLAKPWDIFGCPDWVWRGAIGIWWGEAGDAADRSP